MMVSTTQYLNLHIADQRENILLILHFSFSGTKIRKVESKTKKIIYFFLPRQSIFAICQMAMFLQMSKRRKRRATKSRETDKKNLGAETVGDYLYRVSSIIQ